MKQYAHVPWDIRLRVLSVWLTVPRWNMGETLTIKQHKSVLAKINSNILQCWETKSWANASLCVKKTQSQNGKMESHTVSVLAFANGTLIRFHVL